MVNSINGIPLSRVELAWIDLAKQYQLPINQAEQVVSLFSSEIRHYCELIQAQAGTSVGLLIRGETAKFTNRVHQLMQSWNVPSLAIERYIKSAEQFEHKRAFLKLEWHLTQQTDPGEYLIAYYFRRRPAVTEVLKFLHNQGVDLELLSWIVRVSDLLSKPSVHFVAGAIQPGQALSYKLYFSQYITAENSDIVLRRLLTLMEWFGIETSTREHFAKWHHCLAPVNKEPSIFISISFTNTRLNPSMKIDYPSIYPQLCATLMPVHIRQNIHAEVQKLCTLTGRETLSYLGIRFDQYGGVRLKYYADWAG